MSESQSDLKLGPEPGMLLAECMGGIQGRLVDCEEELVERALDKKAAETMGKGWMGMSRGSKWLVL